MYMSVVIERKPINGVDQFWLINVSIAMHENNHEEKGERQVVSGKEQKRSLRKNMGYRYRRTNRVGMPYPHNRPSLIVIIPLPQSVGQTSQRANADSGQDCCT